MKMYILLLMSLLLLLLLLTCTYSWLVFSLCAMCWHENWRHLPDRWSITFNSYCTRAIGAVLPNEFVGVRLRFLLIGD